ncbi:unnamed protein product [Polarella glacialis]|nr:unnamed protein product [Polarella glacialis]
MAPKTGQAAGIDEEQMKELTSQIHGVLARVVKVEEAVEGRKSEMSLGDMEQLVNILEDRVKEIDGDYRSSSRRVEQKLDFLTANHEANQAEELKHNKTWNLANQVDVIQSLIQGEMRSVRNETDQKIKEVMFHVTSYSADEADPKQGKRRGTASGSSSSLESVEPRVQDLEEKLRKMQDNHQQCNLRLAGLKSAHKHAEGQAAMSLERFKKIAEEVGILVDQVVHQECRMDYLQLHGTLDSGVGLEADKSKKTFKAVLASASIASSSAHASATRANRRPSKFDSNPASPGPAGLLARRRYSAFGGLDSLNTGRPTNDSERSETADSVVMVPGTEGFLMPSNIDFADIEMNTSRIARLGKKVSELDVDVQKHINSLRDEFEVVSQTLHMFLEFLPARLRRLMQKQLFDGKEDVDEMKKDRRQNKSTDESRKNVSFTGAVEVKSFQADDDSKMPWQIVGEPDARWSWCFQNRNEMGRDLANYFEQREHEREEFEQKFMETLQQLAEGHQGPARSGKGFGKTSMIRVPDAGRGQETEMSAGERDKISARIEKAIVPQLTTLEERLDRLVSEVQSVKKLQDNNHIHKSDKSEVQMLNMRILVLEKFDASDMNLRMEAQEGSIKYQHENLGKVDDRLKQLENTAAMHTEVAKVEAEVANIQNELERMKAETKENGASMYNSNKKFLATIGEVKLHLETSVAKLQKEKVPTLDHGVLLDKVMKLEGSMRDNRQILSTSDGQEVSALVKRIILNMEDKMMAIEKKIEALAEGRPIEPFGGESSPRQSSPRHSQAASNNAAGNPPLAADAQALLSVSAELSSMTQVVQQLKNEINVTKVDMEQITEQGQQGFELASRMSVLVESAVGMEEDEGTVLSLNRIQVMIAAAARQLVAGSKWITKETFDHRVSDMRSEYMGESRRLQVHYEDLSLSISKVNAQAGSLVGGPTKLPKMIVNARLQQEASWEIPPPVDAPISKSDGFQARALVSQAGPVSRQGPRRPATDRPATDRPSTDRQLRGLGV